VRYQNLDLIISDGPPGAYPVHARGPGSRSATGTLALDPADADLRAALARIEQRRTDSRFLIAFGGDLHARLFTDAVGRLFDACYDEARAEPATGLRLRLAITPPALAALPWEFLYHARERAYLATLVQCPVVRFLPDERRARSLVASSPLRMLVCISDLPPPYPQLDAARERADLLDALGALVDRQVRVDFVQGAVTEQELVDALGHEYDCFHFIGHGDFADGKGQLLLCGEDGGVAALDDDAVATLFRNATTLKLAFLNACKGATRSGTDLAAGLGPRLIGVGLPAVVAMQYAVQDPAAVLFAREFYRCLFRGDNRGMVDYAASHARARLARHFGAHRDLGTPVVFLRAEDGLVFDVPATPRLWPGSRIDAADRAEQAALALRQEADALSHDDPRRSQLLTQQEAARRELRRLRRVGVSAIFGMGIAFVALWAAALDRLDLGFERYTGHLGKALLAAPLHEALQMVVVTPQHEEKMGALLGAGWRASHARLVRRLADAGARAVVFDMTFHEPGSQDATLAAAVRAAALREPPMRVVLGYTEMFRGVPHVPKTLATSGARFAITCYGRTEGAEWARSLPLAVRRHDGAVWPALPLAAYTAYSDLTLERGEVIAGGSHELVLHDPAQRRTQRVPYSLLAAGSADSQCAAISRGDQSIELLLTHPPIETLRDPQRRIDYLRVLDAEPAELAARFRDRLVLVGAAVERDDFETSAGAQRRFGFELYASAINDLLRGRALARAATPWQLAVLVLMALAGAATALFAGAGQPWRAHALLAGVIVAYLLTAAALLAGSLRMLDGVYHLGALLGTYALAARGARRTLRRQSRTAGLPASETSP
jgi:CHASE2 domain-containing sensor protein